MLTMDQIHHIRDLYYNQGLTLEEVAAKVGCNWKTVRKYVDQEDFSQPKPQPDKEQMHESKLDEYKPLIDKWLAEDKKAPRKQRHTAKRIHKRLQKEAPGYNCSYRLEAAYVAAKKKELRLKRGENYIPLRHQPGEAQADFGYTAFYENDHYYEEGKHLVLSFPYSNGGYISFISWSVLEPQGLSLMMLPSRLLLVMLMVTHVSLITSRAIRLLLVPRRIKRLLIQRLSWQQLITRIWAKPVEAPTLCALSIWSIVQRWEATRVPFGICERQYFMSCFLYCLRGNQRDKTRGSGQNPDLYHSITTLAGTHRYSALRVTSSS